MFRPVVLTGAALVALAVWRWTGARLLAVAVVVVALWHGAGILRTGPLPEGPADLVLYQKNMLYRPADRGPLAEDIRATGADLVTLQEVSPANRPMLDALRDTFPHQLLCGESEVGGVVILSRTPLADERCSERFGVARAVTRIDGQPLQVIALHLPWPWPMAQQELAQEYVADMAPLPDGPTVVGGDFNMVASGRSLAWVEAATGTTRVGPLVRTFSLKGYPLGIDHILATGGTARLSVRPKLGSDHYGLAAEIRFP
ncbi:endonuclease/exonuclease/phosphatase family protein [Thalassorhabdomicrobium marinisediminis]|uniref:endonuclease/exonuclease/phosphatase family protein n=1 Tax=Thalassorhabdomicrobium marinisediminis TaxID=2170577 RepID=UPI0011B293B9|nr:endonuclease/exonuclease/phosphatase family protein [Thalassorhabdomicrobium marinisediminis]